MNNDIVKFKIASAILLVSLGVIGRFFLVSFAGMPNFEIISALSLMAGIYLGGYFAFFVPLTMIVISDAVIGNTNILVFTWTAFMLIGSIGLIYRSSYGCAKISSSPKLAILISLFFFIYTNFGWWIMSGMYEYSIDGLMRCFISAIPFFRNQLASNLIFVPFSIFAANFIIKSCRERAFASPDMILHKIQK